MTVNNRPQDMRMTQTEQISDEYSEMEEDLADEMKYDLNSWGGVLIVLGILELLSDPVTSMLLIIGGSLNLIILNRRVFIVNGLLMILVGLLGVGNFFIQGGEMVLFHLLLVGMGVWKMNKYRQYA